jgi:hypothetical protein
MSQDWAHTAFLYGSHYLRQRNETHDLLMRSMPICISCTALVMGMPELHRGNNIANVCRSEATQRTCICNWKSRSEGTGAFMSPAHIGSSRRSVQNEGRETVKACLRVQFRVPAWGAVVSFSCSLQLVQVLQTGGSHLGLQFCLWLLHKTVDESDFMCRILWTAKATFTRSVVNTLHIPDKWALENHQATRHSSL